MPVTLPVDTSNIPEHLDLQQHLCDNPKSYSVLAVLLSRAATRGIGATEIYCWQSTGDIPQLPNWRFFPYVSTSLCNIWKWYSIITKRRLFISEAVFKSFTVNCTLVSLCRKGQVHCCVQIYSRSVAFYYECIVARYTSTPSHCYKP